MMRLDPFAYLMDMLSISGSRRSPVMAANWVYLDETAHTEVVDGKDRFRDMIVGGCRAKPARWIAFCEQWKTALSDQGVQNFHANDFFSFNGEFRWYRDGKKDEARHVVLRDRLVRIILDHVDEILGYCNASDDQDARPVRVAYKASVRDAFRHLQREWDGEEICIILARHPELSQWTILKLFENMNWDNRLVGCGVFDPKDMVPLQAADFILHGALHRWRNNIENETFVALRDGAKARGVGWKLYL